MIDFAAITLKSPEGSAWEFLVLFLVVILGPPLVQRARVPGIIGLLLGGFLIGPHGLSLLDAGSTTIPDLGKLGLLYLMFVAGVELDLTLLREYRRSAVTFGLMTFSFPMLFGTVVGFALGWDVPASLLLGSLLASHTLVLYPLLREARLARDPMVASAVGATVLTDTIALIILAVVAGTQSESTANPATIALQIGVGLVVLGVACFVVLPWLVRRAFRLLGSERTVRYVIAVAAFLGAAVIAEVFDIEGIVGAFFAGLAMNRLVPNEGLLMKRIDFFGTALFVPVFLVSVGLLLDPSVMFKAQTLGYAALFILACLGGKFVAALLLRPLLGATGPQAGLVFALTTPQAAATLAATTVGFDIGLFSSAVVNAVLVLILVSIVAATLVAEREKSRVIIPADGDRALGERVLVAIEDLDAAPTALRIARSLARRDNGVVEAALLRRAGRTQSDRHAELDRLSGLCKRLDLDTDPSIRVTDHVARAAILTASDLDASLLIAVERESTHANGSWAEIVALAMDANVAILRGPADRSIKHLRVRTSPSGAAAGGLIASIASAIASDHEPAVTDDPFASAADGDLVIGELAGWDTLSTLQPPAGSIFVIIPTGLLSSTPPALQPA